MTEILHNLYSANILFTPTTEIDIIPSRVNKIHGIHDVFSGLDYWLFRGHNGDGGNVNYFYDENGNLINYNNLLNVNSTSQTFVEGKGYCKINSHRYKNSIITIHSLYITKIGNKNYDNLPSNIDIKIGKNTLKNQLVYLNKPFHLNKEFTIGLDETLTIKFNSSKNTRLNIICSTIDTVYNKEDGICSIYGYDYSNSGYEVENGIIFNKK